MKHYMMRTRYRSQVAIPAASQRYGQKYALVERLCPQCGRLFESTHFEFCTPRCRDKHWQEKNILQGRAA